MIGTALHDTLAFSEIDTRYSSRRYLLRSGLAHRTHLSIISGRDNRIGINRLSRLISSSKGGVISSRKRVLRLQHEFGTQRAHDLSAFQSLNRRQRKPSEAVHCKHPERACFGRSRRANCLEDRTVIGGPKQAGLAFIHLHDEAQPKRK